MLLTMLKCKIHMATVTETALHYEGSIGIDRDLIDAAGLLPFEKVDVVNINNGKLFQTYVIEAPSGSRTIARRLVWQLRATRLSSCATRRWTRRRPFRSGPEFC